jgi:RsiW-degrading membrane proteinase PrsW (M82 family)
MSLPKPPVLNASVSGPSGPAGGADLKVLRQHLQLPVEEIRSLRWTKDYRLIGVLLLGLFPLAAFALFQGSPPTVYWCFSFYFCVLWALFFYRFFTPAGVTRTNSLIAFFATGVISTAILLTLLAVGFDKLRDAFLASSDIFVRIGANIFTIGLPEEMCKALVILYLLRGGKTVPPIPTMIFYGLMSGLGIGIYEGMNYPMTQGLPSGTDAGNASAGGTVDYFENLLRLTTLPFLQAMWAAIGAYLWTLGQLYSSRRYGLWAAALGIPAILHGLHASFVENQGWLALIIDLVSLFALMIYLSRSQELEKTLQEDPAIAPAVISPAS